MEKKEFTEMEEILRRTVEKQGQRIASITIDLDLAHSQIEVMKAAEEEVVKKNKESTKKETNKAK
ncbi:MAG TPA: hypothetical protein VK094_00430 [Pseudogracilibacillus sp.]|nr:hypothetical protein [Pseudogracilibacillus sp.]